MPITPAAIATVPSVMASRPYLTYRGPRHQSLPHPLAVLIVSWANCSCLQCYRRNGSPHDRKFTTHAQRSQSSPSAAVQLSAPQPATALSLTAVLRQPVCFVSQGEALSYSAGASSLLQPAVPK